MLTEFRHVISDTNVLIAIASIGLAGYVIHYLLKKQSFTGILLTNGLVVSLGYISVLGGVRVWLLSFDKPICDAAGIEPQYFFIAGIAAIWMAIQEIGGRHKALNEKPEVL